MLGGRHCTTPRRHRCRLGLWLLVASLEGRSYVLGKGAWSAHSAGRNGEIIVLSRMCCDKLLSGRFLGGLVLKWPVARGCTYLDFSPTVQHGDPFIVSPFSPSRPKLRLLPFAIGGPNADTCEIIGGFISPLLLWYKKHLLAVVASRETK